MTEFPTVRVAAAQATPVVLDAEATVDKALRLMGDAAAEGAQLVVLPECFISLYPTGAWAAAAAGFGGFDMLWQRMWDSSVDVTGPLVGKLAAGCAEHSIHLAVSVPQHLPRSAFPADFPAAIPDDVDVLGRGGDAIVDPLGTVIAGPLYDAEGLVIADCDLRRGLAAKRWFDAVGHYGRADALEPQHATSATSAEPDS